MKFYYVDYHDKEEGLRTAVVEAENPGHAFAKALKEHPQAKLLKCSIHGKICSEHISITYEAPVVTRKLTRKRPNGIQDEFKFGE
jgi:hypothetical protein